MHPLEPYLIRMQEIRASGAGVKETSYYSALEHLLNEVGKTLKPWVRAVSQLKDTGAGSPDFGLFTKEQFPKRNDHEPPQGQMPARGAVEVKSVADDSWLTAKGKQVSKYWGKYRLVLVTNYRDFLLLGTDANGKPVVLEIYRLASDEQHFWQLAAHPHKAAEEQGERLAEFLKRVMLHAAPLADPKDVAWFLASYAREAKARIDSQPTLPALGSLRKGLENALGVRFEKKEGDHFFRSTLVQTLFYGVFSAWVLWHRLGPPTGERFDWKKAGWTLHVPMIRALFDQVASPTKLKALNLVEVLDWVNDVLDRVARDEFFARFAEAEAVQYFYEPFLQAFDPQLRKDLGVWYTPPEIVRYMVARVDRVLREELKLADGLADDSVVILDPCCGTGAYLVEVLRVIAAGLKERGLGTALAAARLKRAAVERVFGFELMPAPFVVAHLQLGLLLTDNGAPLGQEDGSTNGRLGVYLTNALTGWAPPDEEGKQRMTQLSMDFPEFAAEHDAAEVVKRGRKILVILGNPPYNAFAGVALEEEADLVRPYKEGLNKPVAQGGWGIKKFNLDELYVRFFRLAERQIAEHSGRGVVCFISSFSYLSDPSFVVMRQRLLSEFDRVWIDCLNGDSRETGKLTPEGLPDPSVFSTEYNREGIRVGTAVGLLVKRGDEQPQTEVRFRDYWGVTKRADLLVSLDAQDFAADYTHATPSLENRYGFRPQHIEGRYLAWPRLADLCLNPPFNGPIERRGNSLVVFPHQQGELELLQQYFDPLVDDATIRTLRPEWMKSSGEFKAEKTRKMLAGEVKFSAGNICRYPFKPLDNRVAYLDNDIAPLFSRPSPELLKQRGIEGNLFLVSRDAADKTPEGPPFFFSPIICDYHFLAGEARHFPVWVFLEPETLPESNNQDLFGHEKTAEPTVVANLSAGARDYLESLDLPEPDGGEVAGLPIPALIWWHALAIGFSPAYLAEHEDGIRSDWPRIPLPPTTDTLLASAKLGREVATLLDTELQLPGVTASKPRPDLAAIAVLATDGNISLDEQAHLKLSAGWGHAGKGGITMPGKGKLDVRLRRDDERSVGDEALGDETCDVWLNAVCLWRNVPRPVWEFTIGGYQVMKKWLSYREFDLLGRALTLDEVEEVTRMARRLAALVLLQARLDGNYHAVADVVFDWRSVA